MLHGHWTPGCINVRHAANKRSVWLGRQRAGWLGGLLASLLAAASGQWVLR